MAWRWAATTTRGENGDDRQWRRRRDGTVDLRRQAMTMATVKVTPAEATTTRWYYRLIRGGGNDNGAEDSSITGRGDGEATAPMFCR